MKRKEGFTLIELLVVMAIIAILAAIVVPNIVGWIGRARMTRAQAEIESIETALAKMLTDASRNALGDLIQPDNMRALLVARNGVMQPDEAGLPQMTAAHFADAQRIYTNTFYALLRNGREVLKVVTPASGSDPAVTVQDPELGFQYGAILRREVVKQLGTSYLEIGFDPWGNLYQIFPAPWGSGTTAKPNPMIYRTFLRPEGSSQLPGVRDTTRRDDYTQIDPEDGTLFGFPAPKRPGVAFIYSYGANLISGQLVYRNVNFEGGLTYEAQEPEFLGGGDDVNNWDSTSSWGRFYS